MAFPTHAAAQGHYPGNCSIRKWSRVRGGPGPRDASTSLWSLLPVALGGGAGSRGSPPAPAHRARGGAERRLRREARQRGTRARLPAALGVVQSRWGVRSPRREPTALCPSAPLPWGPSGCPRVDTGHGHSHVLGPSAGTCLLHGTAGRGGWTQGRGGGASSKWGPGWLAHLLPFRAEHSQSPPQTVSAAHLA